MSETIRDSLAKLLDAPGLAELGPDTRSGALSTREVNSRLSTLLAQHKISSAQEELLRSALLLWHDHLDASHNISQSIHSSDGSFLHGIMHRREPDYGNAKYWFHRVGNHASYPEIAQRAGALLDEHDASALKAQLLPDGQWDAFAMVDACEAATRRSNAEQSALLRELQRIEFDVLLDRFTA